MGETGLRKKKNIKGNIGSINNMMGRCNGGN